MALAPYFDKAALAATDVLRGADYAAVAERLQQETVSLAFDCSATDGEGRVSAELGLNLLARLYPRLVLEPLDDGAGTLVRRFRAAARGINPRIEWATPAAATRRLVIGATAAAGAGVYVGSRGWTALVRTDGPAESAPGGNPLGAAVAACIGAAVLFRDVFADVLPSDQPSGPLEWHLIDRPDLSLPPTVLEDVYLAGVGAIGSAVVWTLARAPDLSGRLHLVDPESVELSNLQRYVLASETDVGRPKVDVARSALERTRLDAVPHPSSWAVAAEEAGHRLGIVAAALDSHDARCEVQASLPRWVVNGWTQPGDLGISRHAFVGDQACLMCLYLPTDQRPDEDDLIAEALGVPDALLDIRRMLYEGRGVERAFLERVADATRTPIDALLPFEGRPVRALYSEGVCGGLLLRFAGARPVGPTAATPLAHQSALAGVLLAAEIVAKAAGLTNAPPPATTRYDVRRPFAPPYSLPASKDPTGRCICCDSDYQDAYRAKHE